MPSGSNAVLDPIGDIYRQLSQEVFYESGTASDGWVDPKS